MMTIKQKVRKGVFDIYIIFIRTTPLLLPIHPKQKICGSEAKKKQTFFC